MVRSGFVLASLLFPEIVLAQGPAPASVSMSSDGSPARRLLATLEMRSTGNVFEADESFRRLVGEQRYRGLEELAVVVGTWKGFPVAGNSFLREIGGAEPGPARRRYRAFGNSLFKQGYFGLAAVELERANVLGDFSEELYSRLLDCYARTGDTERFERTRAIAAARSLESGLTRGPAKLKIRPAAKAKAVLQYPEWVAWGILLEEQGGRLGNALWVNGKLIYPAMSHGHKSSVRAIDPLTGRIYWERSLNPGTEPPATATTQNERWFFSMDRTPSAVAVKFQEWATTSSGTDAGGNGVGSGTMDLDPETGEVLSLRTSGDNPYQGQVIAVCTQIPGVGRREKNCAENAGNYFILTDDLRVSRRDRASGKILWERAVDDEPRVAMAVKNGAVLIPGQTRGLSVLDDRTGERLGGYPSPTDSPLDVTGPHIIVLSGSQSRILGLKIPSRLKTIRSGVLQAAQAQDDPALAEEILLSMVDADPYGDAAALALAERSKQRSPTSRRWLPGAQNLMSRDRPAAVHVQGLVREQTPIRWTARVGSERIQGLAFDLTRVYVLTDHFLLACDKESGREVWKTDLRNTDEDFFPFSGAGLVLDAGRLFLLGPGRIQSVESKSGKKLWTTSLFTSGVWGDYLSPMAANGKVFAGADTQASPQADAELKLWSVAADSGRTLWTVPVDLGFKHSSSGGTQSRGRAAVGKDLVFFPSRTGGLYAVNKETGKLAWTFGGQSPNDLRQMSDPLMIGDRLFVIGMDGMLHGLDSSSGKILWEHPIADANQAYWFLDSTTDISGRLCFREGASHGLSCLDPLTGRTVWNAGKSFVGRPALARGSVWIASHDSITALEPATGSLREKREFPAFQWIQGLESDGSYLYLIHKDGVTQLLPFVWAD